MKAAILTHRYGKVLHIRILGIQIHISKGCIMYFPKGENWPKVIIGNLPN